jgi:hypothetical protein
MNNSKSSSLTPDSMEKLIKQHEDERSAQKKQIDDSQAEFSSSKTSHKSNSKSAYKKLLCAKNIMGECNRSNCDKEHISDKQKEIVLAKINSTNGNIDGPFLNIPDVGDMSTTIAMKVYMELNDNQSQPNYHGLNGRNSSNDQFSNSNRKNSPNDQFGGSNRRNSPKKQSVYDNDNTNTNTNTNNSGYNRQPKICNFGEDCTRSDCKFQHPSQSQSQSQSQYQPRSQLTTNSNKVCNYGSKCRDMENCQFSHPIMTTEPTITTSTQNIQNTQNTQKLCRFGAKCNNSTCTFTHSDLPTNDDNNNNFSNNKFVPTVPCKFGDRCTKPNCTFIHQESSMGNVPSIPCKFGSRCTNSNCTFMHQPNNNMNNTNTYNSGAPVMCRFGDRCTKPNCTFAHDTPNDDMQSMSSMPQMQQMRGNYMQKPCNFGDNCRNKSTCRFSHTSQPQQYQQTSQTSQTSRNVAYN